MDYNLKKSYPIQILKKNHSKIASDMPLSDYEKSERPLSPRLFSFLDYDDYEQSERPLSPNDYEKYESTLSPNDYEKYERPLSPRLFSFLDYDDYEQSEIPLSPKLFSDNYENGFNVPQNIKSLSLIQIFFYSYTHPTILFPPDISRDSYFKKYKGLYQRNDKFFERALFF